VRVKKILVFGLFSLSTRHSRGHEESVKRKGENKNIWGLGREDNT